MKPMSKSKAARWQAMLFCKFSIAHGKKAELVARLEEHISTEPSRAEPSNAKPNNGWLMFVLADEDTRTWWNIIINKILIKINKILHRCVDCWVINPLPLDFHGTGGGGVAHGPVNARPWAEQQWTAHRWQDDELFCARVPYDEFLFFVFLAEALKKNTVCLVVKKRSHQISNCGFLFEQSYIDPPN